MKATLLIFTVLFSFQVQAELNVPFFTCYFQNPDYDATEIAFTRLGESSDVVAVAVKNPKWIDSPTENKFFMWHGLKLNIDQANKTAKLTGNLEYFNGDNPVNVDLDLTKEDYSVEVFQGEESLSCQLNTYLFEEEDLEEVIILKD